MQQAWVRNLDTNSTEKGHGKYNKGVYERKENIS